MDGEVLTGGRLKMFRGFGRLESELHERLGKCARTKFLWD